MSRLGKDSTSSPAMAAFEEIREPFSSEIVVEQLLKLGCNASRAQHRTMIARWWVGSWRVAEQEIVTFDAWAFRFFGSMRAWETAE